jgi:hypothetical protein
MYSDISWLWSSWVCLRFLYYNIREQSFYDIQRSTEIVWRLLFVGWTLSPSCKRFHKEYEIWRHKNTWRKGIWIIFCKYSLIRRTIRPWILEQTYSRQKYFTSFLLHGGNIKQIPLPIVQKLHNLSFWFRVGI